MEVAQLTIISGKLTYIPKAIRLSAATLKVIKENLFGHLSIMSWAFLCRLSVLYPVCGLMLTPMIASAAMAFSSVCVVANSLRLNKIRIDH